MLMTPDKNSSYVTLINDGSVSKIDPDPRENLSKISDDDDSIKEQVCCILKELEEYAVIYIPNRDSIKLIEQLKNLPRTGKVIRLQQSQPQLAVRTVYDHVRSLSNTADYLLKILNSNKEYDDSKYKNDDLAKCIVYHDLCEVLLGDIPAYTNIPEHSNDNKFKALSLLSNLSSEVNMKKISDDFIRLFLRPKDRITFECVDHVLYGKKRSKKHIELKNIFNLLDKTDPIVATWQYIHTYRMNPQFDIDLFIKNMKDFFDNDRVKAIVENCTSDQKLLCFFHALQNKKLAKQYFRDSNILEKIVEEAKLPSDFKKIIEVDQMFYSDQGVTH